MSIKIKENMLLEIERAKEKLFYAEMNDSIGGIDQIRSARTDLWQLENEYHAIYGTINNNQ